MPHRKVSGLRSARECLRPDCIPQGKPRKASKKAGLAYEAAVGKALGLGPAGARWFAFQDAKGPGYCSPDFILPHGEGLVLLECKRTWRAEAHTQLSQLYRPVVEKALGLPVLGVVVVQNLWDSCPRERIVRSLPEAIAMAASGLLPVWFFPRPETASPSPSPHLPREPGSRLHSWLAPIPLRA